MKYFILLILYLFVLKGQAQYTYFNTTYGEFGDAETEIITNVKVHGDSIYVFGGLDNDEDLISFMLKIIDMEGYLIDEQLIQSEYISTLIGRAGAVNYLGEEGFIWTQGVYDSTETKGAAMRYNLDMDSLWFRTYDYYAPYTYFRTNWDVGDGVLISGTRDTETPDIGSQASSFLMKMDYDGNVLWSKTLREAELNIYYNHTMVVLDDGYLLGGSKRYSISNAMLTKTDFEGNVLWEYYTDNFTNTWDDTADTGRMKVVKQANGDVMAAHLIAYDYAGTSPWPSIAYNTNDWWMSLRLSKVNVMDTTLYWEHDYLMDQELRLATLWRILPTDDGGTVAMGSTSEYVKKCWVMKIDSLGELSWFNYYNTDVGPVAESYNPRDMERTSDGGFVIVGEYHNDPVDPYSKSWVMKIDACGDVEWQGCDYVGIQESKLRDIKVYPNPTAEFIRFEGEDLSPNTIVIVYNLYGQAVIKNPLQNQESISLKSMVDGLYQVVLVEDGDIIYSEKFVVER